MKDIIVIAIIVVIIGLASLYVYKAKKRGKRCVGCPYADSCSSCCCSPEGRQSQKNR